MADYKLNPRKEAQMIPSISASHDESEKKREMAAKKAWEHKKLHQLGATWQLSGKSLSEAREAVKYNGRRLTDLEFGIFKHGFMFIPKTHAFDYGKKGVKLEDLPEDYISDKGFMDLYSEGYGFKCGYDGLSVGELPMEFVGKKAFLTGYRKGIQEKANENNESKKRR